VVRGLLDAGKPHDTRTGGIAYPALEKIGSKRRTASCNQASRLMLWVIGIKNRKKVVIE
jgi:hypothetical protein